MDLFAIDIASGADLAKYLEVPLRAELVVALALESADFAREVLGFDEFLVLECSADQLVENLDMVHKHRTA